jgi:TonB-dependent SusC/RagA subfamily outer membrane receptor
MIDGVEVTGNLMFRNGRIEKKPGPSQEDVLNTLSPSDIQSVEIITDASLAAIYGVRGGGGVILITTKRGDDLLSEVHYTPAFASYAPVGFYKARVFYSPVYSPSKPDTATPDLRTTIYWNPNVNTGSNGASSFEFFNAGTAGRYRVVVEGIDHNGHLGRQVYSYDVK